MSYSRYGFDAMNAINNCYTSYDPFFAPNGLRLGNADGSHSVYTQDSAGNVLKTTVTPNWQMDHIRQQSNMNYASSIPVTEVVAVPAVGTNADVSALLCLRCNKRGHIKDACTVLVATPKACCACKSTATFHNEKDCIAKNTCKHCGKVDVAHKAEEDKCINNPKNKCAFCGLIDSTHDQIQCGVAKQTNMIVPVVRKPMSSLAETNPIVVKRTKESMEKNPNTVGDEYVFEGDKLNINENGKYVMSISVEYLLQHLNVQKPSINVNPFAIQSPPTLVPAISNKPNNDAKDTKVEIVDEDEDDVETEKEKARKEAKRSKAGSEAINASHSGIKSILKKDVTNIKPAPTTYSLVAPYIIDDEELVETNTKKNVRISPPKSPTDSFDGYESSD